MLYVWLVIWEAALFCLVLVGCFGWVVGCCCLFALSCLILVALFALGLRFCLALACWVFGGIVSFVAWVCLLRFACIACVRVASL